MTKARKEIINLEATPFYHVVCRCVRRTYLCGYDKETGMDYTHRKKWIVARMKYLSRFFAVNIAAYAVMSNHYHLVVHIDQNEAKSWSDDEVIERCKQLFPNKGDELQLLVYSDPDNKLVRNILDMWRQRLCDLSWFMRCMNEQIARKSNLEDNCKGRFWEGRFKSQALLDEGAVLSAMAYVDLNPVRARICSTPEESEFTSIKERIESFKKNYKKSTKLHSQPVDLMHFKAEGAGSKKPSEKNINFKFEDYLKLVDEAGRIMRSNKKGHLAKDLAPILTRVGLNPNQWSDITASLENNYAHVVGSVSSIKQVSSKSGFLGIKTSMRYYLNVA